MIRLLYMTLTMAAVLAQPQGPSPLKLEPGEFDCTAWDRILHEFVTYEGVRWDAWREAGTEDIDAFLEEAAGYDLRGVLGKEPRIAFLMNAYHAFAMKQILDHDPVESLADIEGFFDANTVALLEEDLTLKDLTARIKEIGKHFPQCTAALAPGAVGYAPLAPRAYTAANLLAQSEAAARVLFTEQTEVQGPERIVTLPGIVEQHRDYFEDQPQGLAGGIHPMVPGAVLVALTAPQEINFKPIDLSLRPAPPALEKQ